MTKAPRAGHVKTRLCPPLTLDEAAALNICFLRDTAAMIMQAGSGGQGIGCFTPAGAEEEFATILPRAFWLLAQREGDFGERLLGAIEDLLALGFASVCLIDSDSPTVPASAFTEALTVLTQPNDCIVLGPSHDGGYYLVGVKQRHAAIFSGIDWSTDRVLQQTLSRAKEIHLPVHLLPTYYDVDDAASLARLCQDLLSPNERDQAVAPLTREFLRRLIATAGPARISQMNESAPTL